MLHAKSTLVFQSPEVWHKGRKITAMRTSSESARLLWTLPSEASCYPAFVELCHFFSYHKEYKWINDDQFSHSSQPRQLIVLPCARSTFARFTKSLIPTHSRQSKKKNQNNHTPTLDLLHSWGICITIQFTCCVPHLWLNLKSTLFLRLHQFLKHYVSSEQEDLQFILDLLGW